MVATHKYKEIYDMQASRRKATWFNMQKPVVNNYALGVLVLRSQHLLKVLTQLHHRVGRCGVAGRRWRRGRARAAGGEGRKV
jgi:hypothetical protein